MANFAVMNGNVVVNVIVADTKEIAEMVTNSTCIEFNLDEREAGIGYIYDGKKFSLPSA
jgi:hypothetical protein